MTDLALAPVMIVLHTVRLAKSSDDLHLHGVDLESGRSVSVAVRYRSPTTKPSEAVSGLVLKLSVSAL